MCVDCGGDKGNSKYVRCYSCRWAREKDKANARRRERRKADPGYRERQAEYKAKSRYGLSAEEYDAILANQGGVCAICFTDQPDPAGRKKRWCVDHDHATGEVRGLLCCPCNRAIGLMSDDPERLRSAARFLER